MKLTRKSIGRIAASFVATAMLATMAIVPASANTGVTEPAEGANNITAIDVSKVVTTDGNTYAPNTSFTIEVTEGEGKTFDDGTGSVTAVAGIAGGLKGTTIQSQPDYVEGEGDSQTVVEPEDSYEFEGTLAVDSSVFTAPGIYHYVVKETTDSYDGIAYSTETYDVYLYVTNNSDYSDYVVSNVVVVKNGQTDAKSDLTFTNDYGKNNNGTHDVKVTKVIAGTLGDKEHDTFSFTVKVNGAEGEVYKVVYTNDAVEHTTYVVSGDDNAITVPGVGDQDYIQIFGLSENDTYTVTENDVTNGKTNDGYTVTDSDNSTAAGTVSGKVTVDGTTATITNTKDASTPTGIMMDIAPYAVLVVIAAAGCFIFLRKRHAKED